MKESWVVPGAIVLGGVILAGAVYFSMTGRLPAASLATGDPSLVRPVSASDHILGSPTAKVTIVEYSDFDCTYCKDFDATLHQIVANAGAQGEVAWVFREFPLSEIHPNALKHAEAAECAATAGGNAGFWKFAEQLYANQPADPTRYGAFAAAAGIPGEAFSACYTNAATTVDARISADRENALAAGAKGTPYSLILVPGKTPIVMDGAYSYDAARSLVEQALSDSRN